MTQLLPYILTFVFVALGLVLAWIAKKWFGIDNSALFASLIFAPVIAYLVLSGQLAEFKGFGLEATFRQAANKTIDLRKDRNISPTGESLEESRNKSGAKAYLGIGSQVVILQASSLQDQGNIATKDVSKVAMQIYPSLLQGTFEFLVIIDEHDRVLGYFPKEFFLDLLRIEIEQSMRGNRKEYQMKRVEDQLQQTQLWDVVEYPRMRAEDWGIKETINIDTSNLEALKTMRDKKMNAIVVVDKQGKYYGIVKLRDIVLELLLSLYSTSTH